MSKPLTRQQAINEHCKGCIHDPYSAGNWRQQVTACTSTTCNLYPYRPVSKPKKPKVAIEAELLGEAS